MRKFLETELGIYFEIISEPDGLSGLQKAQSFEVDLIICDVLMPGMNGFDVTRKLKRDFETSHIPIILLTAMSTSENKLEGVESGADAYITKPLSSRLLLARIFQLIEQREKLKRKFSNDPAMTSQALCSTELDRKFGEKLQTILEKQLDNPEFTIEDFASAWGRWPPGGPGSSPPRPGPWRRQVRRWYRRRRSGYGRPAPAWGWWWRPAGRGRYES